MADSTTNIDTILTAQSQKEVTANAALDALSPATFGGRRASTCSGLTWGYYGGKYAAAGVVTMLANGTVTLTGSATNYVEFDPVAGTVSANQTAFTAGRVPLYSAVCGSSTVTSYTDERHWGAPATPYKTVSVAGSSNVTLSQAQASADVLSCTGLLTGSINVIVPTQPKMYVVSNDTTGAYTLTVKTASGTGVAVGQGKRAILFSDGVNVVRATADA